MKTPTNIKNFCKLNLPADPLAFRAPGTVLLGASLGSCKDEVPNPKVCLLAATSPVWAPGLNNQTASAYAKRMWG